MRGTPNKGFDSAGRGHNARESALDLYVMMSLALGKHQTSPRTTVLALQAGRFRMTSER